MEVLDAKEYQQHGSQTADHGNTAEHYADFNLIPAAQLKMVVDGAHFKQPLAVGKLKISYLQHDGADFHPIYNAQRNQ